MRTFSDLMGGSSSMGGKDVWEGVKRQTVSMLFQSQALLKAVMWQHGGCKPALFKDVSLFP